MHCTDSVIPLLHCIEVYLNQLPQNLAHDDKAQEEEMQDRGYE